ncbi:MAG: GntR family transcriptional regulator [Chloroflexota bacterium]|nr:GntR family transcriptional regulator [Chloroflexota bacterium]
MAVSLRVDRNIKTLREQAVENLRDAILSQHFPPGARLVERTLCEELGVSRTVVREALRHLETEGLVETVSHQGPVVARVDPNSAQEIYEIRAQLEGIACRASAATATDADLARLERALEHLRRAFADGDMSRVIGATGAFYEIVFLSGGKRVAWSIVQGLNARINHLRWLTLSTPDRDTASFDEMRRIYEAIVGRNPDAAELACKAHVRAAAAVARRWLSSERTGGT